MYIIDKGTKQNLIDWHGEVLVKNISSAEVSSDEQYLILQKNSSGPYELYTIDGAPKPEEKNAAQPKTESSDQEMETEEQTEPISDTEASNQIAEKVEMSEETENVVEQETIESTQLSGKEAMSEEEVLLNSAETLLEGGLETNRADVSTILKQVKTTLETENPEAAELIQSAVSLIDAGSTDAGSISTLISTALTMISDAVIADD